MSKIVVYLIFVFSYLAVPTNLNKQYENFEGEPSGYGGAVFMFYMDIECETCSVCFLRRILTNIHFLVVTGLHLPGPEIVKDGITYSSVLLDWDTKNMLRTFSDADLFWADKSLLDNVTFILQKQIIETKSEWQSHSNIELLDSQRVNVSDLHPYLTYQVTSCDGFQFFVCLPIFNFNEISQ